MPTWHSRRGVTSRLRKRGHDYASASSYFLTLCVARRACLFGTVREEVFEPSPAGVVIDSWWHYLPARFASVELDAMVVMPNHFHAVIHLGTDPEVEAIPTLGDIVRWFKIRTTYDYVIGVRTDGWPRYPGRLWQLGFHEHIIRDDRDLERIRSYIEGNPGMWSDDAYHRG